MTPLLCLVVALGLAPAAFALPVNHGNFAGTSVLFQGVTETTQTGGDDECLFTAPDGNPANSACAGAPLVVGDQLLFFPTVFGATATGAGGSDTTHSLLSMTIADTAGGTIDTLKITEFGDVILAGLGTPVTNASVSMSGFVTVLNTQSFVGIGTVIGFTGTFTPKSTYSLNGDVGTTLWTGSVVVDIAGALPNGDATLVQLQFNNVLNAFSESGTSATIQKKVVSGPSIVITVPEPSAALLMLMGAGLLAPLLRSGRSAS